MKKLVKKGKKKAKVLRRPTRKKKSKGLVLPAGAHAANTANEVTEVVDAVSNEDSDVVEIEETDDVSHAEDEL